MKKRLTGYQWGDNGIYIGPYEFDNNQDKEEVHLPPRTTLIKPPKKLAVDEEAAWNGEKWIVRRLSLAYLPDREVE